MGKLFVALSGTPRLAPSSTLPHPCLLPCLKQTHLTCSPLAKKSIYFFTLKSRWEFTVFPALLHPPSSLGAVLGGWFPHPPVSFWQVRKQVVWDGTLSHALPHTSLPSLPCIATKHSPRPRTHETRTCLKGLECCGERLCVCTRRPKQQMGISHLPQPSSPSVLETFRLPWSHKDLFMTSPTIMMAKKKGILHDYLMIESKAGFTSIMCFIILFKVFVLHTGAVTPTCLSQVGKCNANCYIALKMSVILLLCGMIFSKMLYWGGCSFFKDPALSTTFSASRILCRSASINIRCPKVTRKIIWHLN